MGYSDHWNQQADMIRLSRARVLFDEDNTAGGTLASMLRKHPSKD